MVVMTAFKEPHGAYWREIFLHSDTEAGSLLMHNLANFSGMQLELKNMHGSEAAPFFEQQNIQTPRNINAQQTVLVLRGQGVH